MVISEIGQSLSLVAVLSLVGTIGAYFLLKKIYVKTGKRSYMTPVLLCPLVIVSVLLLAGISYGSYTEGAQYISWLLQPATVAFAIPLYKNRDVLKKYGVQLFLVIGLACTVAAVSSFDLARLIGLDENLALSITPRSVTTPLAMATSTIMGGNPTITAILVLVTGIVGMIMASLLIQKQNINNSLLKGLLLGISAHGTGTAKAYEDNAKTGVIASLAMIFMGIFTTFIAPVVVQLSSM